MRTLLDEEIERSFEDRILERGRAYLRGNRVLDLANLPDGSVQARVQGSNARPYVVRIEHEGAFISTSCTCPYEFQCKHGVAAVLKLRNSQQHPVEAGASLLPWGLKAWLESIGTRPDPNRVVEGTKQQLFYLLETFCREGFASELRLTLNNRRALADGTYGVATPYSNGGIANGQFQKHVNEFDRALLTELHRAAGNTYGFRHYTLSGAAGTRLLESLLETGRCHYGDFEAEPLRPGPAREGTLAWRTDERGSQVPNLEMEGDCVSLPLVPPRYVDLESCECGLVETNADPVLLAAVLRAPAIPPEHAARVKAGLLDAGVPVAWIPSEPLAVEIVSPTPVPHLELELVECLVNSLPPSQIPVAFARLRFDYDGELVATTQRGEIRRATKERVLVIQRNLELERNFEETLRFCGWSPAEYAVDFDVPNERVESFVMLQDDGGEALERYGAFLRDTTPELRKTGWVVELVGELEYVRRDQVDWELAMEAGPANDWFEFALGIRVGDAVVDLRDILVSFLEFEQRMRSRRPWEPDTGSRGPLVRLPGGRIIALPRQRVAAIIKPLLELFGDVRAWPEQLRLPTARLGDAERVEAVAETVGVQWRTTEALEALRRRLAERGVVCPLDAPAGFEGSLRDYQREGLAWLQFLREFGFGGVLADDMGLGKTVQILAHLQIERVEGRHDRPSLVVAPTSTLPNWRREAGRFVPDLKVLVLHGPDRKELYEELEDADLVLTNYALLARDRAELLKHSFHLVVLDEAQNVKNASTAAAKVARELVARHRLCLSGTPVENHLDELWSLFEFLMPGLLGPQPMFRREFKAPIEKRADAVARERLAARVRPFLLRRTKQQVALDLPPKTEIVETVEFGDAQRDLYELVRVAMDQRIQGLLAQQGLAKSHIHVLDALLKLRQVCCDPRLVKLDSARQVNESAKLDRLFEMLPVLLEEGRRVLLFSQFTSMLDLIEPRLRDAEIPWVRISGDTADRDTPVQRFQSGEVPLFLISLKAGGTGLNLVAADTVIHYDPWWNPAVERQATDRAHRIGQDKAVMVYKLVASGSVEEKILELQERKAVLAEAILDGTEKALEALTQQDVRWLLDSGG